MKKKNAKDKIKVRLSLRWICIIIALLLIFLSSAISSAISLIFNHVFRHPLNLPTYLWWLILGVCLGTVSWLLLEFFFTRPIKELDKAMREVARGDLDVKLRVPSQHVREIRDLYANFNIMTGELSSTEILQTDFVSNVSHEFKTPINAIEGYATLLQTADADDRQLYADKILVNTRRLSELVSNILLLSKLDNQSIALPNEAYRLDEQIRMALLLLEAKWTEKAIGFDVDMEPVIFVGNAAIMQHVWLNLIDNAVKFSPAGETVTIRLRHADEKIVFEIENRCPPIGEKDLRHMFDKFYQCDSSHKADGNGLGLSLVQKILSVAGGTVRAENIETGCRFTVEL